MSEQQQQEIPWREMVAVLHRRRSLMLQVFLGGFATVLVGVWMHEPRYRATATLMVSSNRARVAVSPDESTRPMINQITEQDMNGEVALIRSETLVREVLEPLHEAVPERQPSLLGQLVSLVVFPLKVPSMLYASLHRIPPATPLDERVNVTMPKLGIALVGRSNLIQVSFDSPNPKWAAELVNSLLAHHLERRAKMSQQSQAQQFYEAQSRILSDKQRAAESSLKEFYARENINYTSSEQRQAFRGRLADLESELSKAETELTEGTARIAFLGQEIRNYPKRIPSEARVEQNQQYVKPRILQLQLQRSELLSKYAPTSVKVQDIERQIAEAKRLVESDRETLAATSSTANPAYQALELDLAQTKAQMAAVHARGDALKSQIAEYRTKAAHLDQIASEQEHLEQDLANAKDGFQTYSKKEEEARFTSALDKSSILDLSIAEAAAVPVSPEKSKRAMVLALGTVMSLTAGIGLAFVRDRLDPTVKNAAEAQKATGLPILAEIRS